MAILVDKNATGDVRFPNFLGLMSQKYSDNNAEDEIREAFKVFDNVSQSYHLILTSIKIVLLGWQRIYQSTGTPSGHDELGRKID